MSSAGSRPPAARAWVVGEEHSGERLDRALALHAGEPRSRIQAWIRAGRVEIDDRLPAKAGETLRPGARVVWRPPAADDPRVRPEPGELEVLFEDADLVVLDKPAGLVVHPGAGRREGTLVHRLVARYPEIEGVGGPGRPGIVHRLDRETSGALVVARTAVAHRALARAFAERQVDKRYLAVVRGRPRGDRGQIEAPIARHPTDRKRMAVRVAGKPAHTSFRVLGKTPAATLLELELHTGRTHQIRVHMKHFGLPLVGDPVYGGAGPRGITAEQRLELDRFPRPALHAWRLELDHPRTGERLRFLARAPADLRALWIALGGTPPND